MVARAYSVHKKRSWLLPTRLLHITRTDENQIPAVLILITYLKDVSGCVFLGRFLAALALGKSVTCRSQLVGEASDPRSQMQKREARLASASLF